MILDNPSDQQAGMSDPFRASAEHAADLRAVVSEVKRRYPGLPLFLVGTSRSTLSVANLAVALQGEVGGAVLSSSLFYTENDGCGATPYHEAARLARRFPLAPHGFFGKEAETVDAIAAWMLKKPFAQEIR